MSMVSRAVRSCFHAGIAAIVRRLWSRSESLMIRTRRSFGHRHEHLPHRGGLLGLLGVELDAVELGDAVDDLGDLVAEVVLEVVEGEPGVLHGVVEEGGGHRDVVEPEVGHDAGDGQRVLDVGLARAAGLAPVGVAALPGRPG